MQAFLEALLSEPWLTLEPKGAIFLRRGEKLYLLAEHQLDEPLKTLCARVPLGRCLCGRVGLLGEALWTRDVDEAHETRYPSMPSHGHAILPLRVGDRVLGVLNLYQSPGVRPSRQVQATLEEVAGILALTLLRERAERVARVLRRVATLVLEAEAEGAYLQGLCRFLVEEGYALAWVGEALPDGQVRPVEGAGAVGYLEGLRVRWDETPEGQGPAGRAIRLGRPQVLRDREQDPLYAPWLQRARAFGLASIVGLPLQVGGRIWGTLNVYAHEADAFDEEEISLLQDLAGLAGKALERFRAEARAHLLAQVVEQVPESILLTDLSGQIIYVNPALSRQTGYPPEEVLGQTPRIFKSGKHTEAFYRALWRTLAQGEVFSALFWNRTKSGRIILEQKFLSPVRNPQGQIVAYVSTGREMTREFTLQCTQQVLLRFTEKLLKNGFGRGHFQFLMEEVLEAIPGVEVAGLFLQGKDGLFSLAALAGCDARLRELVLEAREMEAFGFHTSFGRLQGELLREAVRALPEDKRKVLLETDCLARVREVAYARLEGQDTLEGVLFFASFQAPLGEEVLEVTRFLGYELRKILDWERQWGRARYLTYHDPLTGLPNRAQLEAQYPEIAESRALLLLNLVGFSRILEAHGYLGGDTVLQTLAQRFKGLLPLGGQVYRTGEDEFLFLLPLDPKGVEAFYVQLRACLAEPIPLQGEKVRVGASAGVVFSPADGRSLSVLLRRANLALDQVRGKEGLAFYNPHLEAAHRHRTELFSGLERALAEDGLTLFAQPIVELETGRVKALELLLRWPKEGGFVPAGEFIPLAEETGLIRDLDLYVLRKVAGLPDTGFCLHVNISAQTLQDPRLLQVVEGLRARRLRLELTEYALLAPGVEEVLKALKAKGLGLVLDDFGQGYASLRSLISHPFSVVKVDRTFAQGIGQDPKAEAALRSTLSLAREVGLLAVAEGVETEAQRDWLLQVGYPLAQGYLLGRPAPLERFFSGA